MTILTPDSGVTNRPNVSQLAVPYVYRRGSGRYHLRVRLKGSHTSYTLSLKTANRPNAMTTAKHLLQTLKVFHLDNPEASWDELRARLVEIAEGALWTPGEDAYGLVLSDLAEDLQEISKTMPLTHPQAQAITAAYEVLRGSQGRLSGDLSGLVKVLGELKQATDVQQPLPALICKAPEGHHQVGQSVVFDAWSSGPSLLSQEDAQRFTFEGLAGAYLAERGADMAPATLKNFNSSTKTIAGILGDKDMRRHTRADLVGMRENLLESRKASTVNKLLVHVGSVLGWAVATGMIASDYSKKLTIVKGAYSSREAFTTSHLVTLREWAWGNLGDDWKASAIALGVVTGARIGEIHQLTGADLYKSDGQWVMDINDKDGKTLKNSFSRRTVPILGIPEGHLKALSRTQGRLFSQSKSGFDQLVNQMLRDLLGTKTGEGLSFHSLRHSLASDLKAAGVSVGIAQAILGHSSGSLAFDLYGGNASASMGLMREALRNVR
ncbi:tyrosine-type recombinase/integrase [Pseudomonas putida]|uniref:tyrosine-type recombinase/integrase n=1 Tax=Pseudomonas putida TaxID=303 RepID=UPI0003144846|nr:tyrosine-type recombinase/integrase [Pseudomonas putida]